MTRPPQLVTLAHDEDFCRVVYGGTYCDCKPSTAVFNELVESFNTLTALVYTIKDLVTLHLDNLPGDTP